MHYVDYLLSWKVIVVLVFLFSTLYVHIRGKERLKFLRQVVNHSTLVAPVNCLLYLFSALPNKPFYDVNQFSELQLLRDNWQQIRDEGLQLMQAGVLKTAARGDDVGFNSFLKRGWCRFYLKWYNYNHTSAQEFCPKTVALVNQIPNVKAAMFALLPAQGMLNKHRDPYAGSLRYHLGLKTPNSEDCCIFVDGIKYAWADGKDVIFDETYVHHAYNKTDQYRLILFCDIERPMKFKVMRWFNYYFAKYVMSAASSPNLDTDKTGAINKLYRYIHKVKLVLQKLKKNYYIPFQISKYLLAIAVIAAIVFW